MPYIGNQPGTGVRSRFIYTATASQTTFSGADDNSKTLKYADSNYIDVYLNGVCLEPGTDYTASTKTSVVLTQAASLGDTLKVIAYDVGSMDDSISQSTGGTFEANIGISNTSPDLAFTNTTSEDTDGGRESTVTFKGKQSGNEESTLAQIQASHDGTADDQKGDLIFKTNDGSDGTSPTERLRIDSNGSIVTATLGASNTHLGEGAGSSIASGGNENVLIGKDAGAALTTGDNNTAVGTEALATEDANGRNTAIGFQSLQTLNAGVDGENVAVGYRAGKALTSGIMNTLVGTQAGDALTDADYNTVVGRNAMSNDTKGNRAVAIGYGALTNQNFTSSTDNYNVGVGFNAGEQITTGTSNTLIGGLAGDALTVAYYNVAVGEGALSADVQGSRSVAVGWNALNDQSFSSTTISYNTAVGHEAGKSSTTAQYNTLVGYEAGKEILAGGTNTLMGVLAGGALTSGNGNICIGIEAGLNNVAVDTGTNNIFIGYQARANATNASQQIVLGRQVTCTGNSNFTFGDGGTDSNIAFGATSITAPSDERYKEEIASSTAGLSFINDLRPVTFKWKKEKDVPSDHEAYVEGSDTRVMLSKGETNHGFIAQEVKAAIDAHSEIKDGFRMWSEDQRYDDDGNLIADGRQRVAPSELIPILTKAIQELSAKNDALETRIAALEAE